MPQFVSLVWRFVQTPTPPSTVQRVWPDGQPHTPAAQVAPKPQLLPHMPQCAAVLWRFTHWPPHSDDPTKQTHTPPTHDRPLVQALLQMPQFCVFVWRFTH